MFTSCIFMQFHSIDHCLGRCAVRRAEQTNNWMTRNKTHRLRNRSSDECWRFVRFSMHVHVQQNIILPAASLLFEPPHKAPNGYAAHSDGVMSLRLPFVITIPCNLSIQFHFLPSTTSVSSQRITASSFSFKIAWSHTACWQNDLRIDGDDWELELRVSNCGCVCLLLQLETDSNVKARQSNHHSSLLESVATTPGGIPTVIKVQTVSEYNQRLWSDRSQRHSLRIQSKAYRAIA